jgi:hypothetical protein
MRYVLMCVALLIPNAVATAQGRDKTLRVSLQGGLDSIQKEMDVMAQYGLTPIQDEVELRRLIDAGKLVRVPMRGNGFVLDLEQIGEYALPGDKLLYHHALPRVRCFLSRLGDQFKATFGRPYPLTSLVRDCAYTKRVARGNANAIACKRSSHPTGSSADLSHKNMSRAQRKWVAKQLLALEGSGLIQATKEGVRQATFHVMVYPTYAQQRDCAGR